MNNFAYIYEYVFSFLPTNLYPQSLRLPPSCSLVSPLIKPWLSTQSLPEYLCEWYGCNVGVCAKTSRSAALKKELPEHKNSYRAFQTVSTIQEQRDEPVFTDEMRLQNTILPFSLMFFKLVMSSVKKIQELAVSFPHITCTLEIFKNAPLTLQVVSSKQDLLLRGVSMSRLDILDLDGDVPIVCCGWCFLFQHPIIQT